ncbi:MAG: cytochrome-c oxidase, cbb3-type subunit III [Burkholderiaceae bacterium]|nr:cytochrome-c oxidase, cbb3-type subunit III [Burkholderiaceae bacterium]
MSDFTSNFWSFYVGGITVAAIAGCLLLLWISGQTKAMTTSDNTTGHVWDGNLREMNNPLPFWWVGLFLLTVAFGIAYLAIFPGLGTYPGAVGWTSTGQFDSEVEKGNAEVAPIYARFASMTTAQLAQDTEAMAIGERLFMNNCSQCHSSDARGGLGFPNLTDAAWSWGGTPERIHETITNGRTGVMAPIAASVGSADDVKNVANYVLSLSGASHDSARAALGKEKFVVCAACHNADGKGNQLLGAPDLTDDIWNLGSGEAFIISQINNGYTGVMPAWGTKFTPEQLNVLTAYVWGKGGGVAAEAAAEQAPAVAAEAAPVAGEEPAAAVLEELTTP